MSMKNTALQYGTIAKTLHWLTAMIFLGAYVAVYYRQWFTESQTPENWNALQLHLSFGVSMAVLIVLRIVWRCYDRVPDPEPGARWEHLAAKAGHWALYGLMIVMPLTGYLGTGVATEFFFLFDVPKFEDTPLFTLIVSDGLGIDFKTFEKPIDFIHKEVFGAWLCWMLILGHASAALYHHFVKKDRTLLKMTRDTAAH